MMSEPTPILSKLASFSQELDNRVCRFRRYQEPTGCVAGNLVYANYLLNEIVAIAKSICLALGTSEFAKAFESDVRRWQESGLETPPDFILSREAYCPPDNNNLTFFIAPFYTPNGEARQGYYLEFFIALREEPEVVSIEVARQFPHPANLCKSCHLLIGSEGVSVGNCVVFFPENIAVKDKAKSQSFALFFFSKFQRIYCSETMPIIKRLFGETGWKSERLSDSEFYKIRSLWGYLHDYHHHLGPRPLNQHLQVKLNWYAGLLEELKVDCQTVLLAHKENLPFSEEIFEFILFERLFRYPRQPDKFTNFDSGTGFLLCEWLFQQGAIFESVTDRIEIDFEGCLAALKLLVDNIEDIESQADDDQYLKQARRFVRCFLPKGESPNRFSLPASYKTLALLRAVMGC